MYSLIEANSGLIIDSITGNEVDEYDWLIENRSSALSAEFQRRYKNFWGMGAARLSRDYFEMYFDALVNSQSGNLLPSQLPAAICKNALRSNGLSTFQFSFASKLLHMHNPKRPVFDSRVARFYFVDLPSSGNLDSRLQAFEDFYHFLEGEYRRVLQRDLLKKSIAQFRARFQPVYHTDEKVIDWLIWGFDKSAGKALQNGEIVYG